MSNSIAYELTPELYRRILTANSWHQYKSLFIIFAICVSAVTALSIYGYSVTGTSKVFQAWVPFLVILALWIAVIVWWMPFWLSRNKLNRNQFQLTTLTIEDSRIILQLENGVREEIPIKNFVKSRITDRYTILWKNYIDVVLIPAEVFTSADAYDQFIQRVVSQLEI